MQESLGAQRELLAMSQNTEEDERLKAIRTLKLRWLGCLWGTSKGRKKRKLKLALEFE